MSYENILRMSYAYFHVEGCTPDSIEKFLVYMAPLLDQAGVTIDHAREELERMHNIRIIGEISPLIEHSTTHIPWFNPTSGAGMNRDFQWKTWLHFSGYLLAAKNWPGNVVSSIDKKTGEILSLLEDPHRPGPWARYGMVLGSVQSGKTANYMGLIAKAIDAGYKLVVVLTGVHNSLRSQTQTRLNEEILGYDLDTVQKVEGLIASTGVREMFPDHPIIQTLTSSNEHGDFRKDIAEQAGMIPSVDGSAIVMVVKKHVSILKNLRDWSTSVNAVDTGDGRRVVKDVPLLLIDDECDYASVNTNKEVRDENGHILAECDPAQTNKRIRELLASFEKRAYIGYTATPYANVFISYDINHPVYGKDLFPENFIVSLPRPANYVGPERVFGLNESPDIGIEAVPPLPLIERVIDSDSIIPPKHKKDLIVSDLPESLKEAIKLFLLSCTARFIRKQGVAHNSMLIHVTRFTSVQFLVRDLVNEEYRAILNRLRNTHDSLSDFKTLWNTILVPANIALRDEFNCQSHEWQEIKANLYEAAKRVQVKAINGSSGDSLMYHQLEQETKKKKKQGVDVAWEDSGLHVIAIGGDKLSRGLTLDGLTVSYYLRSSRMYDTLLQMGRWFGFRDKYADLCRIYTTPELINWYRHIATATLELRNELEYMADMGREPKDFGIRVLSHPGQLAITSAGKRRNTEKLLLSYSGRLSQTVVFDLTQCNNNHDALAALLRICMNTGTFIKHTMYPNARHWNNITRRDVIRFLRDYKTHEIAVHVVSTQRIADFIEEQEKSSSNDLVTWDVVVASPHYPKESFDCAEQRLGCSKRGSIQELSELSLTLGAVHDPQYESFDFSDEEMVKVRKIWTERELGKGNGPPPTEKRPPGQILRECRPKERGLLIIYPIFNDEAGGVYGTVDGKRVIGLTLSFPGSDTTRHREYVVNSVLRDAED